MHRIAPPALAAAAALLLGGRGAALRDLSGDEQNMLHLPFAELLHQATQGEGPFWGHLPWSFALRALSLGALGEATPLAWRLHSLLAHAGLSALLAHAGARSAGPAYGLGLGLLLAAHPLLLFYAQDAGNYAWSAILITALALASPLGARPARPGWIAPLLTLNLWNDLYSLPWVLGFGLLSAQAAARRPALRRPLAAAWGAGIGAGLLFLGPLGARLLQDSAAQVALHADPPPPRGLPLALEVPVRAVLRALGAVAGGVTEGRQRQWAAAAPPLLFSLGWIALGWRRGGRAARALLGVAALTLGLHLLAGVVAEGALGRVMPFEPRVHIALPALLLLCVGWAAPALRRPGLALLLAGPLLLPTVAEGLRHGDLRRAQRAAMDRVVIAEPNVTEVIIDEQTARWAGVPPSLRPAPCLGAEAPALLLWAFDHEPTTVPLPRCAPADAPTHRVLWIESRPPPAQERNSSSFQPTRSVAVLGQGLPDQSPLRGWRLRVEAGLPLRQGELLLVNEAGVVRGRWAVDALPAALPPGSLSADEALQLVLTDAGAPAVELARSDARPAGEGGDWALWIDPLELPGPRRALRLLQVFGGLGLLGLALAPGRRGP